MGGRVEQAGIGVCVAKGWAREGEERRRAGGPAAAPAQRTRAFLSAAAVGMDCGSSAWMFLPVGSTPGLRIGSPPGPGSVYLPSRACGGGGGGWGEEMGCEW